MSDEHTTESSFRIRATCRQTLHWLWVDITKEQQHSTAAGDIAPVSACRVNDGEGDFESRTSQLWVKNVRRCLALASATPSNTYPGADKQRDCPDSFQGSSAVPQVLPGGLAGGYIPTRSFARIADEPLDSTKFVDRIPLHTERVSFCAK